MTCQPIKEKPLSAQLREKRQSEMYEDMDVRLCLAELRRALKKRREIREEIKSILEKIEEKKKK